MLPIAVFRAFPAPNPRRFSVWAASVLDLADMADLHATLCRADLMTWARHVLAPLGQQPAAHHALLIGELERVATTPGGRLMIFLPPGSAKSTYASVLFPPWFLARHSGLCVIGASHTATLAEDFSRRVMSLVRDHGDALGYGLTRESAELWTTTDGGRYRAAGVGGPIAGSRADLVMIDDPVKNRAVAESEVEREKAWNWFRADALTRLKPGGRVVLIMTRWHQDDLAGRILAAQGERWRVLSLPAIAEAGDALGRPVGAPLWPESGYAAELAVRRADLSDRDWWALYQQQPRPPEGALFRVAMLGAVDAAPAGGRSVRAWDLAATSGAGDWTAGALLTRASDGRLVIADMVRLRGGPEEVERAIVATAQRDGRGVQISLPQDPGQAGKAQVLYLVRKLAGFAATSTPETGDKATRAGPLAAQINVGNAAMLRAGWNAGLIEELRDFPSGTHDDQVDALSRAFAVLTAAPGPARVVDLNIMGR